MGRLGKVLGMCPSTLITLLPPVIGEVRSMKKRRGRNEGKRKKEEFWQKMVWIKEKFLRRSPHQFRS